MILGRPKLMGGVCWLSQVLVFIPSKPHQESEIKGSGCYKKLRWICKLSFPYAHGLHMRVLVELEQCCLHWSIESLPCVSQQEVPWLCSRRTSRFMSLLWHQCMWLQGRDQGLSHVRRGALGTLSHLKQDCSQPIQFWTVCSLSLVPALFLAPGFVFWQPSAQQSDAIDDEFEAKVEGQARLAMQQSHTPQSHVLCPTLQRPCPTAESIPNTLRKAP